MHNTIPAPNRVHLFHYQNGKIFTFKNYDEAASYDWSDWNLGLHFLEKSIYCPENVRYYNYILRDDLGNIIDPYALKNIAWEIRYKARIAHRQRFPLFLPGAKRSHYRWYRNPKTLQERKWAFTEHTEYGIIKKRARRNARHLPTGWDDYIRGNALNRNWKRFRKHQWRDK